MIIVHSILNNAVLIRYCFNWVVDKIESLKRQKIYWRIWFFLTQKYYNLRTSGKISKCLKYEENSGFRIASTQEYCYNFVFVTTGSNKD